MIIYRCSTGAVGWASWRLRSCFRFPAPTRLIDQFAFATLGGLLAIVYAAAIVGADWNWGVLRNVIARGESRAALSARQGGRTVDRAVLWLC